MKRTPHKHGTRKRPDGIVMVEGGAKIKGKIDIIERLCDKNMDNVIVFFDDDGIVGSDMMAGPGFDTRTWYPPTPIYQDQE